MKKTTRDVDLEYLDSKRKSAVTEEGQSHREAVLVSVYEQIKDPHLEKLRIELEDALKELNDTRNQSSVILMNMAAHKYWTSQKKIMDYTSTPSFRKRIAQKIYQQVGKDEAERFWKGGEE